MRTVPLLFLIFVTFVTFAHHADAAAPWKSGICKVTRKVNNKVVAKSALCGVGKIEGIRNPSLARQAADSRARVDLLRVRRRYDHIFNSGADFNPSSADSRTLKHSTIERRWRDRRTGALYSLAVLELDRR